jgi:putative pyruvate formate lyase activating enzyme
MVPQILEALSIAIGKGLNIPLAYNSGGYDSVEILQILDGIVNIVPDMKYSNAKTDGKLSGVEKNYPQVNKAAIRKMYNQIGDLKINSYGRAAHTLFHPTY